MRYLFGFICVLALGVMGCSETAGTGGNGGDSGQGGAGGGVAACVDNVCPCTEAGIRVAIEAGGDDPYTFNCGGPQTVVTAEEIVIDNDVILDGEGNLTVDGDNDHRVFSVAEGVTAELRRVTVTAGGIFSQGTLTVSNSAVIEGAIANWGEGILTLVNSTVSAGDLVTCTGTTAVVNSTLQGQVFREVHKSCSGGILTIMGSLLAVGCPEGEGRPTSNGYNIESPGDTCGFDQPTDQVGVSADDLNLGELADNGGPTMTHALGEGSVAIDHIPPDSCQVTEDQRGEPRPVGDGCDVGSFERQPEDP